MNEKDRIELTACVCDRAESVVDQAGRELKVLKDMEAEAIGSRYGLKCRSVYVSALQQGILPYRYLRNRDAITIAMQLRLAESRVTVIGAGGLGGNVLLLLARLGIGRLTVVDADVFDETNLNRQALSHGENMGCSKAFQASATVASVNPGVEVFAHQLKLDSKNAERILERTHVAVDALDSISDRFVLEDAAKGLGIPLVHGAVAGFEGQVMTIFPEDPGLELLYGAERTKWQTGQRPEAVFGVPALAPSLIATLQAMEVLKILLNRGKLLRNRMLRVDMETGEFHEIDFERA